MNTFEFYKKIWSNCIIKNKFKVDKNIIEFKYDIFL